MDVTWELSRSRVQAALLGSLLIVCGCGSKQWHVTTLVGANNESLGLVDGDFNTARFRGPAGMAFDRTNQVLYVCDWTAVRRVDLRARTVTTLAGSETAGFADGKGGAAQFAALGDIVLVGDTLFATDAFNQRIRSVALDGTVATVAGNGATGYLDGSANAAEFHLPMGIFSTAVDELVVADMANYRLRVLTRATMNVSTLAGSGPVAEPGNPMLNFPPIRTGKDGPGMMAEFARPRAVVGRADGRLWVGDLKAIRRVEPGGSVTTVAGSTSDSAAGPVDGEGNSARFWEILGIAVDPDGALLVADTTAVRRVDDTGFVETIAGGAMRDFSEGEGGTARFDRVTAIATDTATHLYVIDSAYAAGRIRELSLR